MTAPIPKAVSDTGPRVFFRRRSACSESEISLSIDLQQKIWLLPSFMMGSGALLVLVDSGNRPHSLTVSTNSKYLFLSEESPVNVFVLRNTARAGLSRPPCD
jgi:hypothetical protein